ncbi:MAG TPA: MucR family transcriptional regulator [Rhizobiaceae bacterium]|nr:MucR family transcriptional regulator [Rhizobiaceae bacterium]
MSDPLNDRLPELTAQIVAAYVGKNPVAPGALAELIGTVSQSLAAIGAEPVAEAPQLVPAVNPKKSVFPDYIVCLEDGKHFKSLKRHLNVHYGLSPAEYRQKWDLPADYPMVAPAYAAARSALAKSMGLGRKAEPAKRGRKPA